ncbi:hypothetical protein EDWATA_00579 [Edwardsiella tarda ATCC 23685]|uniref:Uncharacterized protein n=1 Tax=Edwardsiella tarda ATCC 23685 TaxID=500638 RepID=D4F1I9_EDWTA|nr:hypothetical protein EDWATA_00579 [Edwardsiella tarda ATCC 23685]
MPRSHFISVDNTTFNINTMNHIEIFIMVILTIWPSREVLPFFPDSSAHLYPQKK